MRHLLQKLIRLLPLIIVSALLILSIIYFNAFPYDFVVYHLPFALITAKSNLISISDLPPQLVNRFIGFPPLWRYIQAFFIAAGNPRLLILPNLAGLVILTYYAKRILNIHSLIAILSILSFPIVLFGFASSYQDFFVSTCISTGAILAADSLTSRKVLCSSYKSIPFFLIAATSKYQGLLQSIAILLIISFLIVLTPLVSKKFSPKVPKQKIKSLILTLLISIIAIAAHPFYNLVHHSNPFFPIDNSLFKGTETNFVASPSYTKNLGILKSPVNYLFSYTELDWIFRGVVPHYDIDQSRSKEQFGGMLDSTSYIGNGSQLNRGIIRTGGTYAPYAIFVGFLFIYGIYNSLSHLLESSDSIRNPFVNSSYSTHIIISLFALTALFLPQSHNIRYQMYSPMLAALSAFSFLTRDKKLDKYITFPLCLFASVSLMFVFLQPVYITTRAGITQRSIAPLLDYPVRDLRQCKHNFQARDVEQRASVLQEENHIKEAYCIAAQVFMETKVK